MKRDEIIRSRILKQMQDIRKEKGLENPKVTYTVVGKFPKSGDVIKVNGLQFTITAVNETKGKFSASMVRGGFNENGGVS
jgi:hypothetical protein